MRHVKYVFTVLVITAMFSGCSSPTDDDDKGFNIVGTWYDIEYPNDPSYDIIFYDNGIFYDPGNHYETGTYGFIDEKTGLIIAHNVAYSNSRIYKIKIESDVLEIET